MKKHTLMGRWNNDNSDRYNVIGMGIFNQNTLLFNFHSCRRTSSVISFDWHESEKAKGAGYFPLIREGRPVCISMNIISQMTSVTSESHFVFGQDVTGWNYMRCYTDGHESLCTECNTLCLLRWSFSVFYSRQKPIVCVGPSWKTILQKFLCGRCYLEHLMSQMNHILTPQIVTVWPLNGIRYNNATKASDITTKLNRRLSQPNIINSSEKHYYIALDQTVQKLLFLLKQC